MIFSPEYIAICRKLPPYEDWKLGDWGIEMDRVFMISHYDQLPLTPVGDEPIIWLPHRESDWMKMWPVEEVEPPWMLATADGEWWVYDPKMDVDFIVSSDPLLACAKAWEKAVES